jgi:integrase
MSGHRSKRHRNDGLLKRCGCARKRWSECPHPWHFTHGHNGRGYFFNLNRRAGLPRGKTLSKSEAIQWRNHFRTEIQAGRFDAPEEPSGPSDQSTLRQVGEAFVESWKLDADRRAHRVPALRQQLGSIYRTEVNGRLFGDHVFSEIRTADLLAFRDARRALLRTQEKQVAERRARIENGDKEATKLPVPPDLPHGRRGEIGINRLLEQLRRLFNWAIETDRLHHESPFLKHGRPVIKMAKQEARTRRLTGDEEARLLQHALPRQRDFIIAALDTGMRKGELLALQWRDVTIEKKLALLSLRAETTKTNTARTVVSGSARLLAVLKTRRNGPDSEPLPLTAHVFGDEFGEKVDSLKTAWATLCRKAGIEDLQIHDLRREAASRLDRQNVSRTTISAQLGHKRTTTTDIYLGSTVDGRKDELQDYWRKENRRRPRKGFAKVLQTGRADPSGSAKVKSAVH